MQPAPLLIWRLWQTPQHMTCTGQQAKNPLWHAPRAFWHTAEEEEEEEEELPAIAVSPMLADSRERVPTPRVSTTRIGMQEHRLD